MKKTVLIGVTSGIAAYKTLDLISLLKKEGVEIFVVMTKSAAKMIVPKEFEKVSDNRVFIELFEKNFDYKKILTKRKVDHIELADKADVFVVAPATANVIAKLTHGFADDFLTTTALAVTCPIIICPSMNVHMWNNPIVQENIEKLRSKGFLIIEPSAGMLACGYEGKGRLKDVKIIKDEILRQLVRKNTLKGKKVLVTAGGTREKIDEVRYITNRSSGKMGVAIAESCFLHGADVLLLKAKNSVKPRYTMQEEVFETAQDLLLLIKKYIKLYDFVYHSAAVSDFSLGKPYKEKLSSKKEVTLPLKPQPKIIDYIKKLNPKIQLIAFKAEYGLTEKDLYQAAYKKLQETGADAVVANDVSKHDRGFEADTNEVLIVLKDKSVKKIPLSPKREVARQIVEYLTKSLLS